jgi:hypothetical protein
MRFTQTLDDGGGGDCAHVEMPYRPPPPPPPTAGSDRLKPKVPPLTPSAAAAAVLATAAVNVLLWGEQFAAAVTFAEPFFIGWKRDSFAEQFATSSADIRMARYCLCSKISIGISCAGHVVFRTTAGTSNCQFCGDVVTVINLHSRRPVPCECRAPEADMYYYCVSCKGYIPANVRGCYRTETLIAHQRANQLASILAQIAKEGHCSQCRIKSWPTITMDVVD